MKAYERLLKYVQVYTTSDAEAELLDNPPVPSATREFDLGKALVEEMKAIGIADAYIDEHCYVYGTIPATPGYEDKKAVGFNAHMDTAPDFSGENVRPQIHENYDGGDIELGEGRKLDVATFPHLPSLKGQTLITADGKTLLGADDKAGIAEIMTMAEYFITSGEPHGKICVSFTPDEEIGHGAGLFDIEKWGADFAYTVDGDAPEEIQCENFNACAARFEITGFNIHPGSAKDKMKNAGLIAMELNALLPADEIPAKTEGYEGFYHLTDMQGDVSAAMLDYIIRDHDADKFAARQDKLREVADKINAKYGEGTCKLTIRQQYRNMAEIVAQYPYVVEYAKAAIKAAGLTPILVPIRGGTDGAQLTYRGLVCPNLGTGGHAFHGPYEHITVESMDTATEVLKGIIREVAK